MFPKLKPGCKYFAVVLLVSSVYITPSFSQSKWATPAQVEGPYYPRITPKEIDSAVIASVPIAPVGPCCSVEPIGRIIALHLPKYSSTSGQVSKLSRT